MAAAVILAVAAAVHGPRVAHNFSRHHWEDLRFFRHSRTQIQSLADCFVRPAAWPGLYRPLSTNVYYFVGRKLFGNRIEPFHVVSAVFFVANGLLLFALARDLLPGAWALLPPVLFVSRLAHVQLATYGSEFQGLSSVFLSLLSMLLALRGTGRASLAASSLAFTLALLCKETAVVVPAILAVHARILGGRERWIPHAVVALLWAAFFVLVFRPSSAWAPTGFAYDVSPEVIPRYAAYLLVFSNLLVPSVSDLAMPEAVPELARSPAILALLGVIVAAAAAALAVPARLLAFGGRAAGVAAFGFAWFLLGATPYVVLRDRLFMRYGYFAHAGLAVAVSGVLFALVEAWRRRRAFRAAARPATPATAAPAPS